MFIRILKSKIFLRLMSINVFLILVSYTIQFLRFKFSIENPTLLRLFDLNQELNVPTWYEGILLFSSGLILYSMSIYKRSSMSKYYKVLAIIFVFLSLDEVSSIHEDISMYVGNYLHASGIFFFAWAILAMPLLAVLVIWLIPFLKKLPKQISIAMVLAGAMYVFGAVVLEMIGGKYAEQFFQHNLTFNTLSTFEEALELTGSTLFLSTLFYLQNIKNK